MRLPHVPHAAGPLRSSRGSAGPRPGMTLLELTVVVMVLMAMITILFMGARAWKRGHDRAVCIVNISSVQKAVRGYSNLYGHLPGELVPGLKTRIIGFGRFLEETPDCPSAGTYTFGGGSGIDTIPPLGEIYMSCSLETDNDHIPENLAGEW